MKKLIKKVLTSRAARSAATLSMFAVTVVSTQAPWAN